MTQLELRGWTVQESLKGSKHGGPIWYGKGWPDLQIYMEDGRRRIWFAELKQPGNTPTDDQLACHARLRRSGFRVIVAYTLDVLLAVEQEERA
ncbi:VRR-NUC domain-containing protein [Deinococcus hohokamensis]|uniref:VRR-NUC domain-containing protein n=1 Tax=Deinococcus hohokamensis TaxID=309883 RepID=A0ABV9I476_9DEIO